MKKEDIVKTKWTKVDTAVTGNKVLVMIDPQPSNWFCESCGQCGDKGWITGPSGRMEIVNAFKDSDRIIFECIVL